MSGGQLVGGWLGRMCGPPLPMTSPPTSALHRLLAPARAQPRDYAMAGVAVAAALLLRFLLNPILGQQGPFLILTLPVVVTALYFGFGPALLATVLSTVIGSYLFIGARPGFETVMHTPNLGRSILFFLIGLSISIIGGRLRRTQRELRSTAERLSASVRSKDNFLAILGHELRNPLAALRSTTEVLHRAADQPDKVRWAGEVIGRQVAQMSQIADDLLDMAQAIRGQVQIEHQPVALPAVLAQAVEQVRPLVDKKRQHLHLPAAMPPLQVLGDRGRLVQVFANLLNNAAKYTRAEGSVWLELERVDGTVEVRIRDNGRGMEPALVQTLFEPFVQEPGGALAPAEGGLGLGLAIVRTLVQLHGGQVRAHSPGRDQGSTFSVSLPLLA